MILDEFAKNIQIVNEQCIVQGYNLNIQVDPDPRRNYGPSTTYFKCANSNSYKKAKYEARIGIYKPIYIYHNTGKKQFKLNTNDIDNLINLLQSQADDYNGTNWQKLIVIFNTHLGYSKADQLSFKYIDYKKGKRFGNMIPLDLPMPDYTELRRY